MPWFEPALVAQETALVAGRPFAFHDAAVLGTGLTLLVHAPDRALALAAARAARTEIDRLDRILNWRDPGSELSALNRSRRHHASPDLFAVLSAAERWREITGGAFSGRIGRLAALWREAKHPPPDAAKAAQAAERATVELDPQARAVVRPDAVLYDLDALAKGYILDKALAAAMDSPGVTAALLDIGGDIRCAGPHAWPVGLPEPLTPFDNAPLIGAFRLEGQAIATSGCGPRDPLVGGARYSAVLDPRTGRPAPHRRSATAIAPSAMDADALATALLNLTPEEGSALVRATPGAAARLADPDGAAWLAGPPPAAFIPVQAPRPAAPAKASPGRWHDRWVAFVDFTAPPRQMERDRAFRSPYVALWVSDLQNRLVRTLFLVGTTPEWQRDNYIWWGLSRADAMEVIATRSLSTRNTGIYKVLWDGVDEKGKRVRAGRYRINLETSRERGKHTHRFVELDFSQAKPLEAELPMTQDAGKLEVRFGKF